MPQEDERDEAQAEQWHDRLCLDHQEVIMRALTRQLDGDTHTAQDLCQKTLLTALFIRRRLPKAVPAKERERAWLFKIAKNHLSNHWREFKRHGRHTPFDPNVMGDLHVTEPADSGLFSHDIDPDGKLRGLSREDRLILELKYGDDLTSDEIALILGIKPAAARQRLHRAKLRAADLLNPEEQP